MMRLSLGSLFRRNLEKRKWRRKEGTRGREKSINTAFMSRLSLWAIGAQHHWDSVRNCVQHVPYYPIERWEAWGMYSATLNPYWLKAAPTGFPGGPVVKNPLANAGDTGDIGLIPVRLNPWVQPGRSSRLGNGNPLQYSCLGNPVDREALHLSFKLWQDMQ